MPLLRIQLRQDRHRRPTKQEATTMSFTREGTIASNLYGKLVNWKGKIYLMTLENYNSNPDNFQEHIMQLLPLIKQAGINKYELKTKLDGYGYLKIEVKPI